MNAGEKKELPEHIRALASSRDSFWLTEEELKQLMLLRIHAGRPEPVTTEQIMETLEWAESVRTQNAMLEAVLAGGAIPHGCTTPGDYRTMQVSLTPKGEAEGKKIDQEAREAHARSKR